MTLRRSDWIGLVIAGAATGAFVLGVVMPGERRAQRLRDELREQNSAVAADQSGASGLAAVYAEVDRLAAQVQQFERAVPAEHGFAETFKTLSRLLDESGLKKLGIEPGRTEPLRADRRAADLPLTREVWVQPVVVRASGDVMKAAKFLAALEGWERMTQVAALRIERTADAGPTPHGGRQRSTVSFELHLNTYYLPGERDRSERVARIEAEGPHRGATP